MFSTKKEGTIYLQSRYECWSLAAGRRNSVDSRHIGGGGFHLYASAEPGRGTGEEGEQEEV